MRSFDDDIFPDTTAEEAFPDTTATMESDSSSLYGPGSKVGRSRSDVVVGDDGNFYNKNGERVYYWNRPRETDSVMADYGGETLGVGTDMGGYYTEAEIKSAWDADEGMGYLKKQTDWDNYWGFVSERQGLIQTGDLPDPTTPEYMDSYQSTDSDFYPTGPNPTPNSGGRDEEIYYGQQAAAGQDMRNKAMTDFVAANASLMEKYGIPSTYQNDDGDTFAFNGSTFVRVNKVDDHGYWGEVMAGLMVGAFTAGAINPAIAGAFGGGAAGGAASGALGSVIGQGVVTGKIDVSQVAMAGVLGGIGGFFSDLTSATPGVYGGWVVNGQVVGTAGQWGIEKIQWLSQTLGIPFNEAAGIVEGVLTGAVSGKDLEGIAMNAVGGWTGAKTEMWIRDNLGNSGLEIDNWFRDGDTNISTDSIVGLVDDGLQALIDGGMSATDAIGTVYNFFDDGGSLDFIWPHLGDWASEYELDVDLSFCEEDAAGDKPWYCNIGVGITTYGLSCPEWMEKAGLCDLNIPNPCPDGFIDNGDGKGCVKLPDINNPCPDGFIDNGDGKGCVKVPKISCGPGEFLDTKTGECVPDINNPCPDGFIDNGDGKGCVKVPKVSCGPGEFLDTKTGECISVPECSDEEIPNGVIKKRMTTWGCRIEAIECIEGFDLVGQECVKIEGGVECPEGFRSENGKCVEINCPEGTEYNTELGECVRKMGDIECPEGWKKGEDGKCVEIKIDTPNIDVPDVDLPSLSLGGAAPSSGMFSPTPSAGLSYQATKVPGMISTTNTDYTADLNRVIMGLVAKRNNKGTPV